MNQEQITETLAVGLAGKKYIQELGTKGKIAAGLGGLGALGGAAWALKRGDTEAAQDTAKGGIKQAKQAFQTKAEDTKLSGAAKKIVKGASPEGRTTPVKITSPIANKMTSSQTDVYDQARKKGYEGMTGRKLFGSELQKLQTTKLA